MSEIAEEVTSNTIDPSIVKEAEGQGWVPKEKYRGDEKDWVDADVFVKRGREILPILRKNNENLVRELSATKKELAEFRVTAEEFKKYQKETYERKAQALEQQLTQLKAARAQAITDGDGQKVNAIDDAIDATKDEHREAKAAAKVEAKTDIAPPSSIDPTLQTWLDRNDWFGNDKRLTKMTNSLGEALREEYPNLTGQAFLDKLDDALREEFPEKFNKRKPSAGSVESGAGRGRPADSGTKSYEALPADAKAACDKYVKQKLMTRQEYVDAYDWS